MIKKLACLLLMSVLLCPAIVGAQSVEFSLPGLDGRNYRLSDYRGRWVVVNFWATWCAPCVAEFGELNRFHAARHQRDAVVLGVNFERLKRPALAAFMRKHPVKFPILIIGNQPLVPFEPLKGIPTTAIVTPRGELAALHLGPVTEAALNVFIDTEPSRDGDDRIVGGHTGAWR